MSSFGTTDHLATEAKVRAGLIGEKDLSSIFAFQASPSNANTGNSHSSQD